MVLFLHDEVLIGLQTYAAFSAICDFSWSIYAQHLWQDCFLLRSPSYNCTIRSNSVIVYNHNIDGVE